MKKRNKIALISILAVLFFSLVVYISYNNRDVIEFTDDEIFAISIEYLEEILEPEDFEKFIEDENAESMQRYDNSLAEIIWIYPKGSEDVQTHIKDVLNYDEIVALELAFFSSYGKAITIDAYTGEVVGLS